MLTHAYTFPLQVSSLTWTVFGEVCLTLCLFVYLLLVCLCLNVTLSPLTSTANKVPRKACSRRKGTLPRRPRPIGFFSHRNLFSLRWQRWSSCYELFTSSLLLSTNHLGQRATALHWCCNHENSSKPDTVSVHIQDSSGSFFHGSVAQ